MTTSTAGTWRTTVDGEHVYTEDGEWFWFHEDQGWYHQPGLALMPPPPPAGVRTRTWVNRMLTGWPKNPLLGLNPRYTAMRDVGFVNWLTCWFMRVVLVYMWVYKIVLDWGLLNVARAHQKFWYGFWVNYGGSSNSFDGGLMDKPWWTMDPNGGDTDSRNLVAVWIIVVITLGFLYLLYMTHVFTIDPHKGYAMLAIPMAASIVARANRNEAARMANAFRESRQ